MKSDIYNKDSSIYSLICVYKNGKLYRSGIEVNGVLTDIIMWEGQLVTSLMNSLNLKDYIQSIQKTPPEKVYENIKTLSLPLVRLCDLIGIDINSLNNESILEYTTEIHQFAIWLLDLTNAKKWEKEYLKIDLTNVTMEYSLSKEYNCSLVRYSSANIFLLAQIEFAELYKSGIPYIVCEKCGTIYFTYKVKSTKTCPFCVSPSLDKNVRAIDKQAERLYKSNPKEFKHKFISYLISKKNYTEEMANKEYNRQIKKRKKE